MLPPQPRIGTETLCRLTLGALILCCAGCHGLDGAASHENGPADIAYPVVTSFVGPNAGYCETNWTPLDPLEAGRLPFEIRPLPAGPGADEVITYEPMKCEPIRQVQPVPDMPGSMKLSVPPVPVAVREE